MNQSTLTKGVVTDTTLRGTTPRVSRLYEVLKERMTEKQRRLGQNSSIFEEDGADKLPIELRHA